jgi:hypothetical protein
MNFAAEELMQEHHLTSASQPASHVKHMHSIAEERRNPHFLFE